MNINSLSSEKWSIFAKTFIPMFYTSTYNVGNANDIRIGSFGTLSDNAKSSFLQLFPNINITHNPIVVYNAVSKNEVYGYFVIYPNNITNSSNFDYILRSADTEDIDNIIKDMSTLTCYQIVDWKLDSSLRSQDFIMAVFNLIAAILVEANQTVMVWQDRYGEIDYYPIRADLDKRLFNRSFAAHFTDILLANYQ